MGRKSAPTSESAAAWWGFMISTIMEILGHSSIAMTANLYSHVLENLKRDAADAMDKVLAAT